jgi:xeroderma pigmentosum group C-complementing protein
MAPSRGKGKGQTPNRTRKATAVSGLSRRSARGKASGNGDVYDDLLAEAATIDSRDALSDRPLKRRKVAGIRVSRNDNDNGPHSTKGKRPAQTIEVSSASGDDDESDFGFEDVDLDIPTAPDQAADQQDDIGDVSVSVDTAPTPQRRTQRKPASVAEKAYRLLVHKAHILCLLSHCIYINTWCNNAMVQRHLRPLLSKKIVSFLNPKAGDSQFRQNEAFMDGLNQTCDVFRGEFKLTASGMRSAKWDHESGDIVAEPMDRSDFVTAANNLEGSQDTGNQLFCALLRAVGVEARLVCSLQPLPLANPSSSKANTPQKSNKTTVFATASGNYSPATDSNTEDAAVKSSSTIGNVPSARRRLGQPSFAPNATEPSKAKKPIRKLKYPVFWVEAFNPAHQKWIALDPLVTQTINRPSKLEPPASYAENQLSYVIAFESDCVARDVTRRYARAFNAKTRRVRVEGSENGSSWFKQTMRFFRRRGGALDRDQVEDAELAQRELKEGLPANVLDFKDHPYYALERHLKRHDVIHPKREVGKVNAGTAAKPRMEAVFRRQDVLQCRSADKWFRVGREIRKGEQPVKRVPARRMRRARSASQEESEDGEAAMTLLYAPFQTTEYIPAPVVNGKVPRNAFGNLDIYVPSMIPSGGSHVRHALAKEAARALKVDCVDAVTGFQFKGRQGTAITEGVIVPMESADAVWAAIEILQDERTEDESKLRSAVALRMWKRFLTGLRIQERVATYGGASGDVPMDLDEQSNENEGIEAGGFLQSDAMDAEVLPTAGRFSLVELSRSRESAKRPRKLAQDEDSEEEAQFNEASNDDSGLEEAAHVPPRATRRQRKVIEDDESEGEYITNAQDHPPPSASPHVNGESSGSLLPDDTFVEDGTGGGFIADDEGGFLPDEQTDPTGDGIGRLSSDDQLSMAEHDTVGLENAGFSNLDVGGGFLPDVGESDDRIESHTVETGQQVGDRADVMMHEALQDLEDVPMQENNAPLVVEEAEPQVPPAHDLTAPVGVEPSNDLRTVVQDDESDRGSMLSHDPDDEDAEPDWLESD